MRLVPADWLYPYLRAFWRTELGRQLFRELGISQKRRISKHLQHIRVRPIDNWILLGVILLSLIAIVLGAYAGATFQGIIIEG